MRLWLPWSHRLPDYAEAYPEYGQNLVALAAEISSRTDQFRMIDVGANVGDSTRQVLERVSGSVLAVEADPYYEGYLRRNVADADVVIAPVLLTSDSSEAGAWTPVRRGGTTHFLPSDGGADGQTPRVRVSDLRGAYPDFAAVELIKSDTDGFDTTLVPELARVYADSRPVLFFEYDTALTTSVSGTSADEVWGKLKDAGYKWVGLWTHLGQTVSIELVDDAGEAAERAMITLGRSCRYLDVAVVHAEDERGSASLERLFAGRPATEPGAS